MNYLIQRGRVRGQVIDVPDGLPELLSDITREVLRCQPTTECLCQFVIDYLTSVIKTREKAHIAKSIIERSLREVDEIIGDLCICEISQEKAEELCLAMEECFKRFLEKQRCERGRDREVVKFYDDDMLDELIRRCKFSDQELQATRPVVEEAYNRFVQAYLNASKMGDGSDMLYQYFMAREIKRREEFKRLSAAITIQANVRGYLVRKRMKDEMDQIRYLREIEERENAAIKIQRFFRKKLGSLYRVDVGTTISSSVCTPSSDINLGTKFATVPVDAPEAMTEEGKTEEAGPITDEMQETDLVQPTRISALKIEFEMEQQKKMEESEQAAEGETHAEGEITVEGEVPAEEVATVEDVAAPAETAPVDETVPVEVVATVEETAPPAEAAPVEEVAPAAEAQEEPPAEAPAE